MTITKVSVLFGLIRIEITSYPLASDDLDPDEGKPRQKEDPRGILKVVGS